MKCETARSQLLDHLYGLLEDADEALLREHVHDCAECRAALDAAYADADLLSEAARLEADDLTFEPPGDEGPDEFSEERPGERPAPASSRTPWRQRIAAIAMAASALLAVGVVAYRSAVAGAREVAMARNPHLTVSGPSTVGPGAPAEFVLQVRDVDGEPLRATFQADALSAAGAHLHTSRVATDADGKARLLVRADDAAPGEIVVVRFRAEIDGAPDRFASTALLRNPSQLVARVSTDKPLYRPGEPLRVRAVALERFRLTPAGDTWMHVRVLGPNDATVAQQHVSARRGVGAAEFTLPPGAAGGEYRVVVLDPGGSFPEASQKFVVRDFRPPQMRWDLELDKDAYAPGAAGAAEVLVERAEGGVPEGAQVTATLSIDGEAADTREVTVPGSGLLRVPFTVPVDATAARGVLALTVRDGGVVETFTETVRITQDRLAIEYFPESGDLVAGLRTRVYFRVRDADGEPADLHADVLDSQGRRVSEAHVDVLGMGAFDLTPRENETYRLVPRTPRGVTLEGRVPTVRDRGGSVRALDVANAAGKPIRVEVASTSDGEHLVVAECRGTVIAQERVALGGNAAVAVRLQPLPDVDVGGVVRVTLSDPDGRPLAERLVSRDAPHHVRLSVDTPGKRYAPGERVRVDVTARDENGAPVEAVLGVTVVDDAVLALAADDDTPSMPLHFLLGLEVDELEDVQVYAPGARGRLAVDRLLGVQGWRRFAWRDVDRFLAEHPKAGERIVRAPIEPAAAIAADNLETSRQAVQRALRRADRSRKKVTAASLAILGFLAAGITLVVGVRRKRVLPMLGGVIGAVVVFALAFPSQLGAPGMLVADGAAPTQAAGGDWDLVESKVEMVEAPRAARRAPRDDRRRDVEEWTRVLEEISSLGYVGGEWTAGDRDGDGSGAGLGGFVIDSEGDGSATIYTLLSLYGDDARAGRTTWRTLRLAGEVTADAPFDGRLIAYDIGGSAAVAVREYAHSHGGGDRRSDFTQVLYWNPLLVTDAKGRAHFEFDTSDSLTTYRIAVDAHDGRGALADTSRTIENRVPFAIEPKLPPALSAGDEVALPVVVTNDTGTPLTVDVAAATTGLLDVEGAANLTVEVAPNSRTRVEFLLRAQQGMGAANVTLSASGGSGLSDEVVRVVRIQPRGYPIQVNAGGMLTARTGTSIELPDDVDPYGLEGTVTVFPSVLGELIAGLDAMLAMPHGCFEQVSSSNYPNVLALRFLEDHGLADPELRRRARGYLDSGYKQLTAYRCSSGGYDLWGTDPGKLALSAYGLVQFHDMAAVYPVDRKVIDELRAWLLAKRDGQGGFEPGQAGGHGFGGAPKHVVDAYVTWALVETGGAQQLESELDALAGRVATSDDPYFLALAAAALGGAGRDADAAYERLVSLRRTDGGFSGTTPSITSSTGANLDVETTSLAALALLREPRRFRIEGGLAVQWLGTRRQGGRFGSTQATVLALRALHAFSGIEGGEDTGAAEIALSVNGKVVATKRVAADQVKPVHFGAELSGALGAGSNLVTITSTAKRSMPWAATVRYRTTKPPSDPDRAVDLTTTLRSDDVAEGTTVRLDVVMTNRTDRPVANPLVRIAIPAGLEPRAKQLAELKDAGRFAFYETRPREITLYYRDLPANGEERLGLDLVATTPGTFEGPASSAYPYYSDDAKAWAAPLRVTVRER